MTVKTRFSQCLLVGMEAGRGTGRGSGSSGGGGGGGGKGRGLEWVMERQGGRGCGDVGKVTRVRAVGDEA